MRSLPSYRVRVTMWRHSVRSVLGKAQVFHGVRSAARSVNAVRSRLSGSCCGVSGKTWIRPGGFDTGLKTFNSLTKQKEPLILAREGVATWYGILLKDWYTILGLGHILTLYIF